MRKTIYVLCAVFLLCGKVNSMLRNILFLLLLLLLLSGTCMSLFILSVFFLFIVLFKIDYILHRSYCAQERQKNRFKLFVGCECFFSIFSTFSFIVIEAFKTFLNVESRRKHASKHYSYVNDKKSIENG